MGEGVGQVGVDGPVRLVVLVGAVVDDGDADELVPDGGLARDKKFRLVDVNPIGQGGPGDGAGVVGGGEHPVHVEDVLVDVRLPHRPAVEVHDYLGLGRVLFRKVWGPGVTARIRRGTGVWGCSVSEVGGLRYECADKL